MATRDSSPVSRYFKSLRAQLRTLQSRYNPNHNNLHFDALSRGDADLYPSIVAIAEEGLRVVQQHHAFFSRHALYADGMLWYELFLFIRAAANRLRIDHAQAYVPRELVDRLILILARMTRYSTVDGGNITKRNDEALGDTLLAVYDEKRVRDLQRRGKRESLSLDWTLMRVAEVREQQRRTSTDEAEP